MAELVAAVDSREPGSLARQGEHGLERGVVFRRSERIWAVGAVHGEADRLAKLHDRLADRIRPTDQLIYLGDFIGYGADVAETVNELLRFRLAFLARPTFVYPDDIVFLRGQQEEIWQKLLQLQFAVNPVEVLNWALDHGAGASLEAYGSDAETALACARGGPLALTRWTAAMRESMRRRPGHLALMNGLRRAAWTENGALLFVNAGIDPLKPVDAQTDGFWWESRGFDAIDRPYAGFRSVVRGFDPEGKGLAVSPWTVTIDSGCGFGGPLTALCLAPDGGILIRLET